MLEIVCVVLEGSANMNLLFSGADCGNGGGGAVVVGSGNQLFCSTGSSLTRNDHAGKDAGAVRYVSFVIGFLRDLIRYRPIPTGIRNVRA